MLIDPGFGIEETTLTASWIERDPEVARMMGEVVRFASEMEPARRFVFLGKGAIYAAGTTFMSFFARKNRYLARGTRLMIHERKLSKSPARIEVSPRYPQCMKHV